jgi:hypothetical protein
VNDADTSWNGDIAAGPTGDIAMTSGAILGQQRVLRRLMTNQNDYVWHPTYGAGLGQFIGMPVDARSLVGVIKSEIFAEAAVARQPEPAISANALPNGSIYLSISYVDAVNGDAQSLTFTVSN